MMKVIKHMFANVPKYGDVLIYKMYTRTHARRTHLNDPQNDFTTMYVIYHDFLLALNYLCIGFALKLFLMNFANVYVV